ncbi:MFS transporter [Haladaptatus sp. T7]|uniref:MFS transporter n=1 Tax=Haladaptatus sp. T7 TaxID=2029368 RepID=UPI0021A251DC|nr:MFS transporter [Haladaptatus sp. T7]GKZ16018.1 MFS transporter [Haladaptatus sp. T7]
MFETDRRVVALGIARMADAVGNSFLIVVLPLYVASGAVTGEAFGFTEAFVSGLVLALFGLVSSVVQPIAGRLSDRAGIRKLFVIIGLAILAVTDVAFSIAGSYVSLMLIRMVQGVAAALTITASIALVNELSASTNRGGNMGIYNAFRLTGFGAGPLAAGIIVEGGPYQLPIGNDIQLSGFDAAFATAAFAALVSILLVHVLVSDPEETAPTSDDVALAIQDPTGRHLLDPIFTLGLATLAMSTCIALLAPIQPTVNNRLDQGPILFSIQFAAFIGALAVTQPIVGSVSDRVGRRLFIIAGLAFLIPTTLVQGVVVEPWQMIVARVLQGVSGAMVFAPALALAGDLAQKGQSGAQLSVLTVAFGLGISFGQLASGFLIRYGFITPFAFGGALATIGVILVSTQVEESTSEATVSTTD